MSRRVLFVDDEVRVLDGLQRMLRPLRSELDMEFASSGDQALKMMSEKPYDVIISDIRMPGMDGGALLTKVKEHYPDTVRFALSGQSDQETWIKVANIAHQFLAKPCSAEKLKNSILKAVSLRDKLHDKAILDIISSIDSLPSPPRLYNEIMRLMQNPETSLVEIARLVERDVAMSAKVLQLINSAATGLHTHVSSPAQAVTLLGLGTIRALILFIHIVNHIKVNDSSLAFFQELLHIHSLKVSQRAARIASIETDEKSVLQEVSIAGMLHDIGHLVFASYFSKQYADMLKECPFGSHALIDAEVVNFGASHADVGACLMAIWGLSDTIVEAVAFHHNPSNSTSIAFSPLTAVHVADALSESVTVDSVPIHTPSDIDMEYIAKLGLMDKIEVWKRSIAELPKPPGT